MMTLCHLEAKEAFPMKGWIVGHVNECKRNMVQLQGIILKGRWKGFHAAQLKEEVGRKERGLRFLEHFRNFPRRDALGNSTSVCCVLCTEEKCRRELPLLLALPCLSFCFSDGFWSWKSLNSDSLMELPHLKVSRFHFFFYNKIHH